MTRELAFASIFQPIINGIPAKSNDFFRPIESLNNHPTKAPNGCTIYAKLTIHDACEGDINKTSSGFNSLLKPMSDGTTIEGNPSNNPVFKRIIFLTIVANIYEVERPKNRYTFTLYVWKSHLLAVSNDEIYLFLESFSQTLLTSLPFDYTFFWLCTSSLPNSAIDFFKLKRMWLEHCEKI